ncbi:hypothetical protein BH23ACT9_BH23ACT9_37950 [soil metagenome]
MTTGLLVLMGSGETTPTMVTVHKAVLDTVRARTGRDRLQAGLLDSPYSFQENAEEITAKAQHYFDHHVGQAVGHVAGDFERRSDLEVQQSLEQIRRCDWVFAGPGSPSHALRQWAAGDLVDALAAVHQRGGAIVLASAAAITSGDHSIPVYEVYKAGEPPRWLDGLGLVRRLTGWTCTVVPHFDNAEGGTHDTRFCYMGERRLAQMEKALGEGEWILGVDEHTAVVIDVDASTVTVDGRGGMHVRVGGELRLSVPQGTTASLAEVETAATASAPPAVAHVQPMVSTPGPGAVDADPGVVLTELRRGFDDALDAHDAIGAAAIALDTERLLGEWTDAGIEGSGTAQATGALRGMIVRLGEVAAAGMHDHRDLVAPHIETLLHVREDARARRAFEVADHIRGHMDADGVRIKDTREGTRWDWEEPGR